MQACALGEHFDGGLRGFVQQELRTPIEIILLAGIKRAARSYSRTALSGSFNFSSRSPRRWCPSASSPEASVFCVRSRAPAEIAFRFQRNCALIFLRRCGVAVGNFSASSAFSRAVSRASASLVFAVVSEPCRPRLERSVTPATVKLGSSVYSIPLAPFVVFVPLVATFPSLAVVVFPEMESLPFYFQSPRFGRANFPSQFHAFVRVARQLDRSLSSPAQLFFPALRRRRRRDRPRV